MTALRAPFPYFGGKGKAAALIWSRLGEVENYVEPFFGSGAVLLARPTAAKIETVNDKHGYLANFWRAIQQHPRVVARYADGPVNEADLHSRHRWLVAQGTELHRRLLADPEWCDPKIAGWWVWGASCWIGGGWCSSSGRRKAGDTEQRRPRISPIGAGGMAGIHAGGVHLKRPDVGGGGAAARRGDGGYTTGRGVHTAGLAQKRPHLTPNGGGHGHGRGVAASGLSEQLPRLSYQAPGSGVVYGQGIHSQAAQKVPNLSSGFGNGSGVHRTGLSAPPGACGCPDRDAHMCRRRRDGFDEPMCSFGPEDECGCACHEIAWHTPRKMPEAGAKGGRGTAGHLVTTEGIYAWFEALSQRLRRVRVCCGDWSRVMGPSVIYGNGITGIVLDPPYAHDLRSKDLYAEESGTISGDVRRWAIEHGDDPRLRIALCGYEGEHEMPASWACVAWKANGGYANVAGGQNKHLERIWFSPHCVGPAQGDLFAGGMR